MNSYPLGPKKIPLMFIIHCNLGDIEIERITGSLNRPAIHDCVDSKHLQCVMDSKNLHNFMTRKPSGNKKYSLTQTHTHSHTNKQNSHPQAPSLNWLLKCYNSQRSSDSISIFYTIFYLLTYRSEHIDLLPANRDEQKWKGG